MFNSPTQVELKSAIIRNPIVVAPKTKVLEAIAQMNELRSHYVLVVEDAHLLGVFTEQDVVRLIAQQQPLHSLVLREVMSPSVVTLQESGFTDALVAINLLQQHHVRQLPIVDECDRLVGLITHESLHQALNIYDYHKQAELERQQLIQEIASFKIGLEQSETRFCRIFESNIVGMMFTDLNGRISDANDRFLEMLGYTREDLSANRISLENISPPEYLPIDLHAIQHLRLSCVIEPWEKVYYHKDGYSVHVLVGLALLSEDECIFVIVDISDRKQAEELIRQQVDQQADLFEKLQQELCDRQKTQQHLTEINQKLAVSNEELARATRLKDEFLANMSHELRTPLNAILGMTEGMQEQIFGKVTSSQIKALQTIERSGSHLLELINDILDVAKIESGQIDLEYSKVSVEFLCQSCLTFIKQQAHQKGIQLETKILSNLSELNVDERRIRQVLINLLNNAVKFTPDGGRVILEVSNHPRSLDNQASPNQPPPIVSTKPELARASYLYFSVIDTGIGISLENISKLFQPFMQIDSALNRQYQGTGLGLALVKRIVEMHGGIVMLTSEIGVGSCFTIALPYTASTAALPSVINQPEITSKSSQNAQSCPYQILLVEDNELNSMTISSYLTAKGYKIAVAKNRQEAIASAQTSKPDLILIDIQKPIMEGLEATKKIRQIPSLTHVPIIAIADLAIDKDVELCLAAGANDYLIKPVKLKQLTKLIQQFLVSN
jgi:PAS domain S-box-containing protein